MHGCLQDPIIHCLLLYPYKLLLEGLGLRGQRESV